MKRQNVKATWDEGWVGKRIHGPSRDDDPPHKEAMTVHDEGNDVILYTVEDGVTVAYWRTRRAGFVR